MSFAAFVVIVLYMGWLAATVVNQFQSRRPRWMKMLDIFGVIPVWTFFAPNPGMTDYYLLYRDRLPDGLLDNWKNVRLKDADNGLRLALLNPTKRKHKALSDLVASLSEIVNQQGSESLHLTVPYIQILNFVTSCQHSLGANGTQFMVLEHHGFAAAPQSSRVIMVSGMHRLQ